MKKKLLAGIMTGVVGIFGFTTSASAATISAGCVAGGYPVTNTLDYRVVGSNWEIRYILYQYSPSNQLSVHNNLNERLYSSSGSLLYAFNSTDTLLRDGELHSAHYFTYPLIFSIGQNLRLTNIIDVPNAADPQCNTNFYR